MDSSSPPSSAASALLPLSGERLCILGPLQSMSRKKAAQLLEQHGGTVVANLADGPTLVLIGDETTNWRAHAGKLPDAAPPLETIALEVIAESDLWQRLGLVNDQDADQDAPERFYTPVILADLVGAPVVAIRRWLRRGYLQSSRQVGRLAYLAMPEVHVARTLTSLLDEGCSLAKIDKLVAQLTAAAPDVQRPLVDLAPVVQEGRFYFRRGDDLAEPSGQLLLDFDAGEPLPEDSPPAIGLHSIASSPADSTAPGVVSAEAARAVALDRQAEGDIHGAIDACRAALLVGGDAEDHFLLAELLYRSGDLSAARERYYAALELDEGDVEARVNLGCVLAESGEPQLAVAAFQGAIDQQPDFADAHYHLAQTLDELDQGEAALEHWRQFLRIAPASPWAEEAEARLREAGNGPMPGGMG